jgi:alpha-galactosidase
MQVRIIQSLFLIAFATLTAEAQVNSQTLALTPPMGWNDYNHYNMDISDAKIRSAADWMVSSGMRDAGYAYVNIDDGWEGERGVDGIPHPNNRFPDMKALADYVHAKGLRLGIYSSPGPETCGGMVGSYGHEAQDARMFAQRGIDYLKYDLCSYIPILKAYSKGDPAKSREREMEVHLKMENALRATGRPIVYSLCQYGRDMSWAWGPAVGANMWRTTADIKDNYDRMSVLGFSQAGLSRYVSPGHWNDPDMLEVGNGGMNRDEYQTHMSLWSLIAAPLTAGNDLTTMNDETKSILLNREVIAIDQDVLGRAGDRVYADGPIEVWTRPLANGDMAVGIFNRGDYQSPVELDMARIGIQHPVLARDLWAHKSLGRVSTPFNSVVPKHGVVLLRLSQRDDDRISE